MNALCHTTLSQNLFNIYSHGCLFAITIHIFGLTTRKLLNTFQKNVIGTFSLSFEFV